MRWPWQQPPLAQPDPGPSNAAVMEQLDIFRRSLKRFEGELDEAMNEHRALRARMVKALEKAEKGPQQPAGPTIGTPEGVTPPPHTADRALALALHRQRKAGA